jgi:hypothetical protein
MKGKGTFKISSQNKEKGFTVMNEDTIFLLRECNAGCKSATNSMEQVMPYLADEKLKSIIDEYNDQHIKLADEGILINTRPPLMKVLIWRKNWCSWSRNL